MTTKADYSKEEWDLLCAGPMLAGLGVTLLDPGLVSGMQEGAAIHRVMHDAKATYADNALISAVIADIEAKGEAAKKAPAGATPESVLAELVKVDAILDAKGKTDEDTASEGLAYRTFLQNIAEKAANAAGGIFGLGEKVSEEEAYYLKKLKEILFRDAPAK